MHASRARPWTSAGPRTSPPMPSSRTCSARGSSIGCGPVSRVPSDTLPSGAVTGARAALAPARYTGPNCAGRQPAPQPARGRAIPANQGAMATTDTTTTTGASPEVIGPRAGRRRLARPVYWLRLGATGVAAIVIALLVGLFGLLPPRLADTLIHPDRVAVTRTPANLGLGYEDVTFAGQGVELSGWYVPAYGDAAVVLVHGFASNRTEQLGLVLALHAAGFHVLLYDQRGVGASGGDAVTFGLYEAGDLAAAADYLRARSGAREVGAVGISLGASVALLAAGQGAPLGAVVADSAFADLEELVSEGTPVRLFVLGSFVGPLWRGMSPLILWHAERQSGLRAAAVRPVANIGKISPRPI